ncbi:MAG TPA: M20/M25/M40 family metallo-hydrolase [Candidatus Binataceae bacterium]|nr:M20/M25/M40 family metallo-hydrolase [Candidatus Binataceae bacterium]
MEPKLFEWCQRLIEFPSVTTGGTRGIAEFCATRMLAPGGISARLIPSPLHGEDNVTLMATIPGRDEGAIPLVFNTHLDTVPPGDPALWTACGGEPMRPRIEGDRIYGLGAADTKLDFAAKVAALTGRRPRRTVFLIGSFGEERGLLGAKEIASRRLLPERGLAYVGEPSGLSVVTAHKGLIVFELGIGFEPVRGSGGATKRATFRGRSAHSSTPHLGHNAIKAALSALGADRGVEVHALSGGDAVNKVAAHCEILLSGDHSRLGDASIQEHREAPPPHRLPYDALRALADFIEALERFAQRSGPPEADYPAPTLTCNPGLVRSSERAIQLEFELRPPPSLSLDFVRTGVAALVHEMEKTFPALAFNLREVRASPGYRAALDSPVVTMAMEAQAHAGVPLTHSVKTGCTEAGVYAAAGLLPVVFGPGPSAGNIHAPNEYNLLSEVEAAVRFYTALLEL